MRRGEVWLFNLDPSVGHEQAGMRPALVVSVDELNNSGSNLVIVVPITSKERLRIQRPVVLPPEGGLKVRSWIIVEQPRTVSMERAKRRLGTVSDNTMSAVTTRLRWNLGL